MASMLISSAESMVMEPVSRLTYTLSTPSMAETSSVIALTQCSQVMPVIVYVVFMSVPFVGNVGSWEERR